MKLNQYECLGCGKKFEAEWLGPAFLMATECPYCKGGVGLANETTIWEDGCLTVKNERAEPDVSEVRA